MVVPQNSKDSKVPAKLESKLGWDEVEIDEAGKETKRRKKPTWQEVGERNRSQFGEIRTVKVGGETFLILELELSFIHKEIDEVLKLQKANKKDFFLLTRSEAVRWLAGEDVFQR